MPRTHANALAHRRRRTGFLSRDLGVCGQLLCPLVPVPSAGSSGIIGRRGGGRGVCIGVCAGCGAAGGDEDDAVEGVIAAPLEPPEAAAVATTAVYASPSLLKAASARRAWLRSGWSCSESFLYAFFTSASLTSPPGSRSTS